jgi:RHS repeat-associated protein
MGEGSSSYFGLRVPAGATVHFDRSGSITPSWWFVDFYGEAILFSDIYDGTNLVTDNVFAYWDTGFNPPPGPHHFESHLQWTNNTGATKTFTIAYHAWMGVAGVDLTYQDKITIDGGLPGSCNRAAAGSELFGPNPALGQQCTSCHGGTGNSVDTLSGNEHYTLPGDTVAGRGPGLDFQLAYNSLDAGYSGPLGHGWHNTYDMALSLNDDGTRTVFQETGSTVTFTNTGGVWSAPPRFDAKLVHNGDGSWTFTRNRSEFFTFNSDGRLASIADRNGYTTTVHYDSNDLISDVEDDAGRKLIFTWANNRIVKIADPLVVGGQPRAMVMSYNSASDLTGYTDIGGGQWTLGYDSADRLTSSQSPRFAGTTTSRKFHYDAQGRVDWEEDPQTRRTQVLYDDPQAGATRVVDPAGHSRVDWYTGGLRTKITTGWGEPGASDTTFTYAPQTQMVTSTLDPDGKTWTTQFADPANPFKVTKSIDPLGRTRTMTYDAYGQLLTLTDGEGVVEKDTYDTHGNPRTAVAAYGTPAEATTAWVYGDAAHPGDATQMTDARGKVWHYTYDPDTGDRLSSTDPVGDETTWTYNPVGWVTSTVSPRGNKTGANPDSYRTSYTYDAYGAPTQVTDPTGKVTTTEYDADGEVVKLTDPDQHITTRTYTDGGDLATETDGATTPAARTTTYAHNPDGQVTSWSAGGSATWSTQWDAHGRASTQTDANGLVTHYTWDAAGNLVSMTQPGGSCTGTLTGCVSFGRDAAGELTSVDYSDPGTPDVTRAYDNDGRRTSETVAGQGTSTWTWTKTGQVATHTDAAGEQTSYGWDPTGNLVSLTYPGQTQPVTYSYDAAGRMASVDDWTGNHTTFGYDADSELTDTTYPTSTGLADHTDYDANGRVSGVTWGQTSGTALGAATYGRDDDGQVTATTSTGTPAEPTGYTYDPRDQLATSTSGAAGNATFVYDENGYATRAGDQFNTFDPAGELTKTAHEITLVGTAKANAALLNTTVTLTLPAGIKAEDQILLVATYPGGATISTPPAGYTLVAQDGQASGSRIAVYRKTATGTETSATVGFDSYNAMSVMALVYRGVDVDHPVAAVSTAAGPTGSDGTFTVPTTTDVKTGSKLVYGLASTGSLLPTTVTPPAGMTSQIAVPDQLLNAGAVLDQTIGAPGPSGARTATLSQPATAAGVLLDLNPNTDTYTYDSLGNRLSTTTQHAQTTTYAYDQANRLTTVNGVGGYAYDGDGLRNTEPIAGTTTHDSWSAAAGLPLLLTQTPLTGSGQLDHTKTVSYIYGPGGQVLTRIDPRPDITLVGSGSIANGGLLTNAITVPLPAGVRQDDQILLGVSYNTLATPTVPAGYTVVGTWVNGSTALAIWRHTATAQEPASLTITFSNAVIAPKSAVAMVYRGVDPADPVVDSDGSGTATAGTTVTVPGLDATGTHDKVVAFAGAGLALFGTPAWTPPQGHTLREQATATSIAVAASDTGQATTTTPASNGPTTFGFTPASPLVAAGLVLRQAPTPQRWYHHDQLGSVRILTDQHGRVVGTASYTPYGKVAASTGELGSDPSGQGARFGYAGQYTDPGTGFLYLRARYYDPTTSQFLTRDPQLDSTQAPYAYAANNPANLTDPTGQCPICIAMAVGAITGGIGDLATQAIGNLIAGCPAFHDISWGEVATAAAAGALTDGGLTFLGRGLATAANAGNRVFWSGSQAANEAATNYALTNGSKTLEMTSVGQLLQRIPRGSINDRITKPLWDIASTIFAGTARGDAHVFIGEGFRGGASVFGRIEGPLLNFKGNPILQHFGDAF